MGNPLLPLTRHLFAASLGFKEVRVVCIAWYLKWWWDGHYVSIVSCSYNLLFSTQGMKWSDEAADNHWSFQNGQNFHVYIVIDLCSFRANKYRKIEALFCYLVIFLLIDRRLLAGSDIYACQISSLQCSFQASANRCRIILSMNDAIILNGIF